jgi:GalNAc-alpha-(1->4)-GalNAc-alpha-(1->3)-diNAcBac-PP-undecaprenol alpha-1,4-N-acetyl-D-galactosaminyltransferase
MSTDVNIAIFTRILSNTLGGMEKQILSIADGLISRGHSVTIISLDQEIPVPFFETNPQIRFIPIAEGNAAHTASLKVRFRRQRKVIDILKKENASIALTFMTGSYWYSVVPSKICNIPVVLAERNSPAIYRHIRAGKQKHAIFLSMIFSSLITVQFESYKRGYPKYLRRKMVSIPNQIPRYFVTNYASSEKLRFVYAGRFSHQKQVLQLIHAFVIFHQIYEDTLLEIYGDGELKEDLLKTIIQNEASDYIFIKPSKADIQLILEKADVMLAPSLWEGFPNSVAEALSFGVPVGGFNDCDGVRDLLVDGENGWLVDRVSPIGSITQLLEKIYKDKSCIPTMRIAAKASVEKYCGESANNQWEAVLKTLL